MPRQKKNMSGRILWTRRRGREILKNALRVRYQLVKALRLVRVVLELTVSLAHGATSGRTHAECPLRSIPGRKTFAKLACFALFHARLEARGGRHRPRC